MPRMTICRSSLSLLCALGLAAPALAQAPKTHTVKKGDTLWDIARTYLGDPFLWPQIYRMNTDVVEDPHWIYPGEVLRLDAAPGEPAVPTTDTPPPEPGIVVVSPGDTLGDGLDLFRRRRATNVQEAFKLYRDVKYHPLRAGEFYSAGFLSEGDSLPYGRVLGPVTLTSVGLGAMIGTGIFVLTGTVAAQHTGPAITIAFLVAAIGCGLAALCYAELASMIPICGSAYSYTYATLGEGLAWFVGWNLALEYLMSASAVAVSWSGYVVNLLGEAGVTLPAALTNAPLGKLADGSLGPTGALLNVPAVLIVAALSWLCYIGVQESTRINNIMVAIKISIIILFILVGVSFVDTANWHPYLPPNAGGSGSFGWSGVMTGAAIIFFAYIGFDQAATTAQARTSG